MSLQSLASMRHGRDAPVDRFWSIGGSIDNGELSGLLGVRSIIDHRMALFPDVACRN